jgi:hypothetical protein
MTPMAHTPRPHGEQTRAAAILGGFDGTCSLMGLVLYMALRGSLALLVGAVVAGAVGAANSMGAGEWLSVSPSEDRNTHAAVMWGSTLVFSTLPAVPLFASHSTGAILVSIALAFMLCAIVAWARPGGFAVSVAETYGAFVLCVGVALGASILAGSVAAS